MNQFNLMSVLLIQNICNELGNHPGYQDYDIDTSGYDMPLESIMMFIRKNGVIKHKYLFMPNDKGAIYNIKIYQNHIDHECQSIRNSGLCFGLPVDDVSIYDDGLDRYIDVYIGDYSHLI